MKKIALSVAMLLPLLMQAQLAVKDVLCENRVNPVGIDNARPQFSWQLSSPLRNTMQSAFEIRVSADPRFPGKDLVWSSGKIASDQSVHVPYSGAALTSAKKYFWQVRVWDQQGKASPWSGPAYWQMGLLQPSDWKAKWISAGYTEDSVSRPSPMLRTGFSVSKKVRHAVAFITSHGLYEAHINGKRVGDSYLTPGFTSYNKRLQYQVYDVTPLLENGDNAVGVMLGNGWYRGNLAWAKGKDLFGKDAALLFQLQITYEDGSEQNVVSDGTWKSSTGAIRSAEIYHGEWYDAREEKTGWDAPGYNDAGWQGVTLMNFDNGILHATYNEPVRKHETFQPQRIFTTPAGEQVIDFGQNLVGFVQVRAQGKAGDKIVLHHAEVLDKAGNFYTANLRVAKQQDVYVLKGSGVETFEPHFTFQGFRYVKVDGYPGKLTPGNFTAVALYSDMRPTGKFSCSNALLNQLQHNIQWGQRGNFLDVPTDCPQRDERLGWTGDAQVFSRTAAFNMGVEDFFSKWLKDVAADQNEEGSVPFVVPNVLGPNSGGSAGWADVATIIPWNMYLAYGNKRILEDQYASMKAWVDYMKKKSNNDLWNTGFHFGDWLFYRPDDDNDGRSAITDKYLIAQCFYAHSTQLLINAARVLGKEQDALAYAALLQRIRDAFVKEYVTPSGRLVSSSQTAYVLALNFDMLPDSLRQQAAERLVQNIHSYNNHLTTGFLGTPYLCHVLTRFGYNDMAYTLLMQDTYPSWLYPVKMGATTIWERWDGQKPDGSFQTPAMNSFNHYAYGAIGDWMYRAVTGIDTDPDGPGYKHIIIKPHPTGPLEMASASLETYYGRVSSDWKKENGSLALDVEIPCNTIATVYAPAEAADRIMEGNTPVTASKDIRAGEKANGYVPLKLGSGHYHFIIHQ